MKAALILVGVFTSMSAAGEELPDNPQEPSVEILGVKIARGMPEAAVRTAFPSLYCAEKAPGVDASFDHCSVSDDASSGAGGEITFKDGFVYSATRSWVIPEDAKPLEVLMMLNKILTRLTGEKNAACAKVETYVDQEPTYIYIALPEKIVTVQMHIVPGRTGAYFNESLRVNPVPDSYRTRGDKMQGAQWCGYVN